MQKKIKSNELDWILRIQLIKAILFLMKDLLLYNRESVSVLIRFPRPSFFIEIDRIAIAWLLPPHLILPPDSFEYCYTSIPCALLDKIAEIR